MIKPLLLTGLICLGGSMVCADSKELSLQTLTDQPQVFSEQAGVSRSFTWWIPPGADRYTLPVVAGLDLRADDRALYQRLQDGSPWNLKELPFLAAQYGRQNLVVIVPHPHYASLVVEDRIGIRFEFPPGRNQITPCTLVAQWAEARPLESARVFRKWRAEAKDIGDLHRARSLTQKIDELPRVERLLGAGHFYLWGPTMFSRHDVPRNRWIPFAKALLSDEVPAVGRAFLQSLTTDQHSALKELAEAEWPMKHLTVTVAEALNTALMDRVLIPDTAGGSPSQQAQDQSLALETAFKHFLKPRATWGDGMSVPLLQAMEQAGIERAVLCLSDLKGDTLRPDVLEAAERLGYLMGPYDSYHSVHAPDAKADDTWETAQFDRMAFEQGRVIKAKGRQQQGFKGRGYHFSPKAAWPYVQQRVGRILENQPYSAWFIDCDATAECFDDFHPQHPANRIQDMHARRHRLQWLESEHGLVVGSEGGSVLFADVIHFGHGVHTPYIGHLNPGFRDRQSPYFLGRHWPPDTPEQSFKPINVPPALRSPWFDPRVRVPLYQAALGDELVATHHWSFDSLKFSDLPQTRALFELLYMVPPMYHLNRETWPLRKDRILHHLRVWAPWHRRLAQTPLTDFRYLSRDRLVQRAVYETSEGEVHITVNFSTQNQLDYPAISATIEGAGVQDPVRYHPMGDMK